MGFSAGDITKEVFAYWGRPSELDLRPDDVITILNRKVNRLLQILQVSDKNYLAVLSPAFSFNGTSRTKAITFDDFSTPVRVESRSSGDTNDSNWTEEFIGDFGSWNDAMESQSIDSVAFYGQGDTLTMAVNRDPSNLEFRILYETGNVSLSNFNDSVPALQNFARGAIFYGTAADAGMMLDNLEPQQENSRDKKVRYVLAQEEQAIDDFKKWVLNTPGQSVAYREAFNSTRPGHGQRMNNTNDPVNAGYFSRY
jgi:hypothetical protein